MVIFVNLAIALVFTLLPFSLPAAHFVDVTLFAGVDYEHRVPEDPIPQQPFMTAGAAAGDYNNDGWMDLYVTLLDAPDLLFKNNGNGTFTNVASSVGLGQNFPSSGAAWGDIDNDGDQDLYVSTIGAKRYYLYINNGLSQFTEEAIERGAALQSEIDHSGFSVSFGDYDRDGWLDIHTTEWDIQPSGASIMQHSVLLRNEGSTAPGYFYNVTNESGVLKNFGQAQFGFSSSFSDMDRDGWPDLVIAADFETSQIFWNNGDGTFTEGTAAAGVGTDENGMGSAIGDYDGDGLLDWFVSSIYSSNPNVNSGNRLYRNLGNRTFSDQTDAAGVRDADWGWGSVFFDFDNDGDLDLTVTNGEEFPRQFNSPYDTDRTRLWENEGGFFNEVGLEHGITDTGSGKGIVTFDYDNDGDLDLFIANNGGHPVLYNNQSGNNMAWLRVRTVGQYSNKDGIGAFLTLEPKAGGPQQVREITGGSNFLSQNELTAHFGLGQQTEPVARLSIRWPSGLLQVFKDLPVNSTLIAVEEDPFHGQSIGGYPQWRTSNWYGNYHTGYWPWIFHAEHGWLYINVENESNAIYLWDSGLKAWCFINESNYRWIYLFGQEEGWVWAFSDNTPGRRFFQRLNDGSLIRVSNGT